ncbi:MAG: ABC transporter permease [Xanthomonadales bacterium]|nr:ABC transporter permease [Xanthomonadales bacterium]
MIRLALLSLFNRRGTVLLTVFTIAISTALLVGVERLRGETRASFSSTIAGTDLIVGARAGSVQLLLYSVFRIGEPTANVSWQTYQEIAAAPPVVWTVPLSLGDSHRGHRVLGTTPDYFQHYRYGRRQSLVLARGELFDHDHDAVLGSEAAARLGYGLDDEFVIAHGIGRADITTHDEHPFRVTGILAPTGTPVDRTIHVSLAGIDAIHADWQSGAFRPGSGRARGAAGNLRGTGAPAHADADASSGADGSDGHDHDHEHTPGSITAFLVGLNNRAAAFALQRQINEFRGEPMTAIMPGMALQQLWSLTGVAENALRIVAAGVVVVGLLGMLTALLTTLNERRREMAILRSVGARPRTVLGLLVLEAASLTVAGSLLGLVLLYAGIAGLRDLAASRYGLYLGLGPPGAAELVALAAILIAGLLIGAIPAWLAYRRSLGDGLTVRT